MENPTNITLTAKELINIVMSQMIQAGHLESNQDYSVDLGLHEANGEDEPFISLSFTKKEDNIIEIPRAD